MRMRAKHRRAADCRAKAPPAAPLRGPAPRHRDEEKSGTSTAGAVATPRLRL